MPPALILALLLGLPLAACGKPAPSSARPDAAVDADAGSDDDAGTFLDFDAGSFDAGGVDDGGVDAGAPDAGQPIAGKPDAGNGGACLLPGDAGLPFALRAVAANLSSGNLQSYEPGEGLRILQGLRPDVVMIQEFNYWIDPNQYPRPAPSPTDLEAMVGRAFPDAGFAYARGSGQLPNGVISRWPIVSSGEWSDPQVGNRTFAWAKIDLPGPRDLWVVSVHLLTSNPGDRAAEARALVEALDSTVPPNDFLLIGGDFNTGATSEGAFSTLSARVVTSGRPPVDQSNNPGTNTSRNKPYDQVLASGCLQPNQRAVHLGANQFDAGLVFDSRVYTPLADVAPVLQGDSAASSMQHMAVVKDFLIQP